MGQWIHSDEKLCRIKGLSAPDKARHAEAEEDGGGGTSEMTCPGILGYGSWEGVYTETTYRMDQTTRHREGIPVSIYVWKHKPAKGWGMCMNPALKGCLLTGLCFQDHRSNTQGMLALRNKGENNKMTAW